MASKYPRAHSPFWWIKYKTPEGDYRCVSSGLRRDNVKETRSADKLVDRYEREESKSATNGDRQHSAFVEWVPGFLESNYNTPETAKTFEAYGWRWHSVAKFLTANQIKYPRASEVKCMHFHSTEVLKPIPSYQIYKGTVFDLVDQAVDFVMSKINRAVGTRAESNQAPVTYELPHLAVAEAIVNAITHRDYTSNASVQVMLFSDRLEVWNPGELPGALTIGELRLPHASIPRNPLIAEPMFLAHYAEKAGSGILDMFKLCAQANLPPPEFRQSGGQFIQTLNRDWMTDKVLAGFNLNDRQIRMLALVKQLGRVTNRDLRQLAGVTDRTTLRDLKDLLEKGLLEKVGVTGRATHYVISRKTRHKPGKPDIKP